MQIQMNLTNEITNPNLLKWEHKNGYAGSNQKLRKVSGLQQQLEAIYKYVQQRSLHRAPENSIGDLLSLLIILNEAPEVFNIM